MSDQSVRVRRRFWIEATLASVTGVMFVVTLFWHEWLEAFGFDPDHGDGSAEWLIVAVLAVVCLAFTTVARLEWRRAALDPA
jgi:DMSO/TMAO reductase YedYZ heme-binding membrane subunit